MSIAHLGRRCRMSSRVHGCARDSREVHGRKVRFPSELSVPRRAGHGEIGGWESGPDLKRNVGAEPTQVARFRGSAHQRLHPRTLKRPTVALRRPSGRLRRHIQAVRRRPLGCGGARSYAGFAARPRGLDVPRRA